MFDPFLVKMGPLVVMALFVVLAGLAMAPAAREVLGAHALPLEPWFLRLRARVERDRRQVELWLRHHAPCTVLAGRLPAGAWRDWLRR